MAIIGERTSAASFTREATTAQTDSDHSLVGSKIRLKPRKIHHAKSKGRPRINTCTTAEPAKAQSFATLQKKFADQPTTEDTDTKWSHLRDAIYDSAMSAFRKKERKNADWFEAHWDEMQPVTEAKRIALLAFKQNSCHSTRNALRVAKSKAQQTTCCCANMYWQNLCTKIQTATNCGYAKGMCEGIKTATSPTSVKTAPLKAKSGKVITNQSKQLQRWVEHYLKLYSTQNIVTDAALDALPRLPAMEELDEMPTLEELSKAIDNLACGKAPGLDSIPAEVLKHGKPSILQPLHELLCHCWEKGHIPQDMRDASIVTLYKNKGDQSDCNNCRGISLLSIVGKVFARVALGRLQTLASRVYPESQCGFRAGRSTVDMIFSLHQLQEKCRMFG
ncbi:uncharacterized protein LOC110043431 [Orbicella faveolata]|uniref:uncharacterized protein LOC110043431 n=1 Tax=Orbicella faveolata TaxID=48498 RepID=UPI0009E2CC5B|nr:uncharacterized protein LOC110043431 [Orbicella faveolata]